jgi:hypothetical protein
MEYLVFSNCDAACEFGAEVVAFDQNEEFGYFSKVVFEPGTLCSPERYRPQCLVDLSAMAEFAERNLPALLGRCCEDGACRNEPVAPLIAGGESTHAGLKACVGWRGKQPLIDSRKRCLPPPRNREAPPAAFTKARR